MKKTYGMTLASVSATWLLRRALIVVGLFAIVAASAVATSKVYAATAEDDVSDNGRIVTLFDHGIGVEQSFMTTATTVGEALNKAGVEVDPRDRVEPGVDETLVAAEYAVNVYRARPLLVVDGSVRKVIMTAAQVPRQVADDADISLHTEDVARFEQSTSPLTDGAAERFVVTRATAFEFTLYGETFTARTQADTVGEMLAEKDITIGDNDRVSTSLDTPITEGMELRVWREGKQTITVDEKIEFEVEKIQDANREVGYRDVRTAGKPGQASVTYEVTIRDGKEVSRKKISSVVKDHPVKQVEVVGAKFNYTGGPLNDEQIHALGMCESGMNPTTNTGNGFHGAFQFMHQTWQSVAPAPYNSDYAYNAPLDAQKQAVQNLLSRSSIFTQFPSCANQMRDKGIL